MAKTRRQRTMAGPKAKLTPCGHLEAMLLTQTAVLSIPILAPRKGSEKRQTMA